MQLDDRITIATPEGVDLELTLAGLGSRFIAGTVDLIIQLLAILLLGLVTGAVTGGGRLNTVGFVIGSFLIWFAYPILFEVLARGRTPGKRFSHLRVVRDSGAPVDLPASTIRNLVRVVDGPLLAYLPTVISIAATKHNQRPGDLAAGTLVIRQSTEARGAVAGSTLEPASLPAWDVSAVTPEELATVRGFLERRETLDRQARRDLALRLAEGLSPKVAGARAGGSAERFLETLAEIKFRQR